MSVVYYAVRSPVRPSPGPVLTLVILLGLGTLAPLGAQQWAVDDAAITPRGGCQLESWAGEPGAWLLPACTLLGPVEVTGGLAHFDRGTGKRELHGQLEAKLLFRDADVESWGWGLAVGAAFPFEEAEGVRRSSPSEFFAIVPLTLHIEGAPLPLSLHANAGWFHERELHGDHAHDHSGLLGGVRADLGLTERVALIGELLALEGEGTEAQVGFTLALVPDLLFVDLSWGLHLSDRDDDPGLQVGIAWTPAPFR